jgi:hypothetical protein
MPKGIYPRTEYHNSISRRNGFQKGSKVNLGRKIKPSQGFQKGHPSYLTSEENRKKLRDSNVHYWKGKKRPEISGRNNYQWIEDRSLIPYPEEFNDELKEFIRERDNRVCQLCGKTEKDNLNNLCMNCNKMINHNRSYYTNYFKSYVKS